MGSYLFYCYNAKRFFVVMAKDSWEAKHWAFLNIPDLHYYTKDITGEEHNYETYKV